MSGNLKLKKHKITGVIFHEESKLVVKSVDEKRVVIGRLENNVFIPIDDQTKELCRTFTQSYGFKLDEEESSSSSEEEKQESSSEEESPTPIEHKPLVYVNNDSQRNIVRTTTPTNTPVNTPNTPNIPNTPVNTPVNTPPVDTHTDTPTDTPQNTPQIKPISVVIHNNSQFSLEETSTPSFFQEFETSFNDYVKEKQGDIKELEDKKSKLMSQVDVLEKQIRAIRTMFM